MKRQFTFLALTALAMAALVGTHFAVPSMKAERMVQISGIGYYAEPGACTDPQGQGASYALSLTGSLSGCDYVFVETARCSEGGAYLEVGTETFVGIFDGQPGTFMTNYVFTAKYRDCANLVGEINGRCQHPVVDGSGTGAFEGLREARFDMRDNIATGNFPYRGHLLF